MIWLLLLFTITTCKDVNFVKNTDPFSKVTTIRGTTPLINLEPYNNSPLHDLIVYPDFELHLYRVNDNISIVIEQTMLYESSYIGQNLLKPILGADSKLQILFDNDEVINIRYTGRRIVAIDSGRSIRINGHFRMNQNHVVLLKNHRVKLLRVEFENSNTDREFNSENENYFINYLNCLEL